MALSADKIQAFYCFEIKAEKICPKFAVKYLVV